MIDVWIKPYNSADFASGKLNLSKLSLIDSVDLNLIPKEKIKWIRLIAIVSSQIEHDQIVSEAQKHNINHIIFISDYNTFHLIYQKNVSINIKYFNYVDREVVIPNSKPNNTFFFTDDDNLYSKMIRVDYFWPDFQFSDEKFNSLKISVGRKKEIVPFSVYNPDSEIGVNFNPIGKCLIKAQSKYKIDISVIIPHYDNYNNLRCVLNNLRVEIAQTNFNVEVILVDDGSLHKTDIDDVCLNFDLTVVQIPRQDKRKMGDCAYRAGVARNLGALYASGHILLFQDCDILISSQFLNKLIESHKNFSLIMPKRFQLNQGITKTYSDLQLSDVSSFQDAYWSEFYDNTTNWNERVASWKYVSSYCLSIQSQLFFEVGGFSSSFVSYGCEDVDLGYRLYASKKIFHLSDDKVFHLQPRQDRSEFNYDSTARQSLLRRAFYYLYKRSYSEEVFNELILGKQK